MTTEEYTINDNTQQNNFSMFLNIKMHKERMIDRMDKRDKKWIKCQVDIR